MDFLKELQLSALNLKSDFEFNPLDVDNVDGFKTKIKNFISTQLQSSNEKDVLNYISRKLEIWLEPFYNEKDIRRFENIKNLISWISTLVNAIDESIAEETIKIVKNKKVKNHKDHNYRQWAMFTFYLQEANLQEKFNNHKEGILNGMKEFCTKNGLNHYTFKDKYYEILNDNTRRKGTKNQINNIKKTIELLNDFPKAKQIAEEDLKLALVKLGGS